jgi:superfamily II DNA helicase RecQ
MSLSKLKPLDDFHYDSVTMVDPKVDALILRVFNLSGITLRAWQKGAIYCLMNKYDLLVKAGTGTGKTWVFWSMALSRPKAIVLVIAPLKAIMKSHVRAFDSMILASLLIREGNQTRRRRPEFRAVNERGRRGRSEYLDQNG